MFTQNRIYHLKVNLFLGRIVIVNTFKIEKLVYTYKVCLLSKSRIKSF